jgi:O-antigen ligase
MRGDESIEGRWLYIQFSAESIGDTPLGVGAGGFPVAFRQSSFDQFYRYYNQSYNEDPQGRSAHNMFLEVAVEIGVIGGLVFLLVVAFALYENRRTARHLRERGSIRLRAANDAVFLGLFGFAFAGLFLSAQYEKTLWLFLALVPVLKNLAYEGEIFVPDLRKLRRALARRGRPA